MADRRIEWQIALDSAGVSKGVKGIDAELSAMRKAFDSLQNVKAFDAQLTALNDLASKLEAAKAKAAALAPAAETGGKAAQNAYNKAAAEVARLEQSLRSQTSAVAASATALDKAGISTKDLAAETARVAEEYKAAAAAAGQAAKAQEAWAATGVRSTKELEAEIAKLQQLTSSGLLDERGIAAAEARIKSLNRELGRTPPEAKNSQEALAGMATAAASLAAAVGLSSKISSSVKEYSGLVDNLRAAQAMAGETEESFAMLKAKAIDLASGAAGPKELAAGFLTLASAGQSAQSMVQLTPIVENMAAGSAGALNFASAGNFLTQSLKLFQLSADDAVKVSDTLVKGWSSTATEANELKEAVRAGGSVWAKAYEDRTPIQRLQEYVATAGAAANAGFQGELAGTALKNSLARLINPAAEARAVLDKYKDTIRIFDNTGKVRDFSLIIDDLGRAGLSAQESMALFGEHAGPVLNALVAQGGQAIRDLETKIKNADGAAQQTRDTMQKGLGGAFRELNAQLDVAGIKLVDSVAKPLELVVRGAAEAVKIVSGLPQPLVAATAGTVGMVTAAAGITSAMAGWKLIGPTVLDGVSSFVQIQKAAGAAELSITAIGPAAGVAKAGILSVGAAASAMLPTIAAFGAAWGVGKIVEFGQVAVETYQAVSEASAAASRAQEQQGKYEDRLKRASAAAGVELKSWQEVQAAYQAGILDYDKMTDTYSKGSGVARAAADVHTKAAQEVGAAAAASRKSIEELDAENNVLFDNAKKKYEEYAKAIKEASKKISETGLLPTRAGGEGLVDTKKALESLASTAKITGAAMTKSWDDPAAAIASYTPRLLGAADAEEAAVRQSLVALSAKDKALEAQHRQTLLNGKLIIEQESIAAEVSKMEQEIIWDIEDAYRGKLDAIMEVKSANGALIPGMQMVAGVWTNIGVAADRSNKQQLDGQKVLESLASTAKITGAAMTKSWDDPADAVASYVPRLLGVADAEEAAVRQSLVALSAKDKALEAQHRQTLLNGKLIIEQEGVAAEVSKIEQEIIWDIEDAYRGKLDAIMEVKSANGALIPGMQMVAGVWTNIGVAADRSNKQQLDGLQGLRLGMSSLADELFDLSLVGKTQEQVWKANQLAAAQYLQSAKELGAQAKREALRGNDEGAKQLWAAEAAAIGKADALYKKLAVTVKTEWSPAMEAAHKQSTESITKFGGVADKALDLARAGYDKVADAAKRSVDAQQYFADKLRDVARESMTGAQAYEDIKKSAGEATAKAALLAKAGDWKGAQEQAKAAAEVWAQVPKEVKDGEQILVSAAESAAVRAAGIKQAAEISKAAYAAERKELEANAAAAKRNAEVIIAAEQAIVAATAAKLAALKEGNASAAAAADEKIAAAKARAEAAQKEVEAAAQKSGDSSGAQATQAQIDKINKLVKANEEAAAKIKALEEDKGKVISTESENAKVAAEGVAKAQQQLVDAYDQQRKTLEGLASTEVAIMESVAKATTSASAEIKAAAASAAAELEKIKAGIDAIPANKEVTITVREVQARAGGGLVQGFASGGSPAFRRLSSPHITTGSGLRDDVPAMLMRNEYVLRASAVAAPALKGDGLALATAHNHGNWERMQSILAKHLGPPQIKLDMPATRQQPMPQLGVIKLHVGDVQAEVYATPDNAAAIHAAITEAQRRAQHAANARRRAGVK